MSKKLLAAILALCMMLSMMSMTAFADTPEWADGGGYGSVDDPYLINSYEALNAFAFAVTDSEHFANTYIKLGDSFPTDSGPMTESIGFDAWTYFSGHFDGNNKTVTLDIEESGSYIGFFCDISYGATVSNLTVTGSVQGTAFVGGITGYAYLAEITNCCNKCSVSGSGRNVGGIAAYIDYSSVTSCTNQGNISGNYNVGGIVGSLYDESSMTACTNTGKINGNCNCWLLFGHCWNSDQSGNTAGGSVTMKDINNYTKNKNIAYRTDASSVFDICFYDGDSWRQTTYKNEGFSFSTVGDAPDQTISAAFAQGGRTVKFTVTYTNNGSESCTFTPIAQADTMIGSDDRGVNRLVTVNERNAAEITALDYTVFVTSDNTSFTATPCEYDDYDSGEYETALEYPFRANAEDSYIVCSWSPITLEAGESTAITIYVGAAPEENAGSYIEGVWDPDALPDEDSASRRYINTDPPTGVSADLTGSTPAAPAGNTSNGDANPNTGIAGTNWTF